MYTYVHVCIYIYIYHNTWSKAPRTTFNNNSGWELLLARCRARKRGEAPGMRTMSVRIVNEIESNPRHEDSLTVLHK